MKKPAPAGGGHTAKHTATAKHTQGKGKHHPVKAPASHHTTAPAPVHTVGKPPKKRALAAGEAWACCSAEAVAASLRVAGGSVSDSAVLALHGHAGGSENTGTAIGAALAAVSEFGLDGVRPLSFGPVDLRGLHMFRAGLILGVELPGPHAVTVAGDGCWLSWGEHHDPAGWPGAVVEEAWVVAWP